MSVFGITGTEDSLSNSQGDSLVQGDAILDCQVESVLPFGVFVRLKNGDKGYIRRRELTLSGDQDPGELFIKGQSIRAIAIQSATPGKTIELSVKACLPDPWLGFLAQHAANDVVQVVVKNLHFDGVYAEIVPGVNGFIPLRELATQAPSKGPDDVVWPGDRSEAVITSIDRVNRKIYLSIRQRQMHLAKAEIFMDYLQRPSAATLQEEPAAATASPLEADYAPLTLTGPVLVVEDHQVLRQPLVEWLSAQGCQVIAADSADQALTLCQGKKLAFAIVDLDLPETNGIRLAHRLRKIDRELPIAVTSGPDMLAEHLSDLQQLGTTTAFPKPLDTGEIRQALALIAEGKKPPLPDHLTSPTTNQEVQDFQALARLMRNGHNNLDQRLQAGLQHLVRELRADIAFIFRLDLASQAVSILAQSRPLYLSPQSLYALIDSPVKDVITEGITICENRISPHLTPRFRNLLDILAFESCIGIPLEAGGRVEHALFVFKRNPNAFPPYRLRDTLSVATLFNVILENRLLQERVQAVSGIFLSGQMASAFSHEVYNKVSGLDLQISNVQTSLNQIAHKIAPDAQQEGLSQVQKALDQAVEIAHELKGTVQGFQRLLRTSEAQWVNIHQALLAAKTQVNPIAQRHQVRIDVSPADESCLVGGSSTRLQQVFLNLMLNAVQHMASQPEKRRVLKVTMNLVVKDDRHWTQIRFIDTGSGIHKQHWENIFALGFTTRESGSGLGLFIARSILEAHGGTISVEESLISLGTTFLVELPCSTNIAS